MLIGEIVKITGISKDTIRFYEKMGLIKIPKRARRENNYKEYPESILKKLMVIQQLKGFGFTLNEIDEIIRLYEADVATCQENIPKIENRIKEIDLKINQLLDVKRRLQDCMKDCVVNCPDTCSLEKTLTGLK